MKIKEPGAHLDHLLRQTRQHHVQLSSMADLKANILMTIASVLITLSVRYITDTFLRWPAMILMLFCLLTIVLAVYTIMPKVPLRIKKKRHPDIHNPNFNILFFGNFVDLDYPEFEENMETIMNDPSQTYEVQVREIYTLGTFLAQKKYRFIRLAYLAFIIGLVLSGLAVIALGFFT